MLAEVVETETAEVEEAETVEIAEPAEAIVDEEEAAEVLAEVVETETAEVEEPEVVEVAEAEIEEAPAETSTPEQASDEPILMASLETEQVATEPEVIEAVEILEEPTPAEILEEVAEEVVEEEASEPEVVEEAAVEVEPWATEEVQMVADAEEAAKTLDGMFTEVLKMVDEEAEEPRQHPGDMAEKAAEAFAQMFSEMTDKIERVSEEKPVIDVDEEKAPVVERVPSDQKLVTLIFRDANLNAVLDIIARKGDLNIIAGQNIKGKVTVRLVEVPLDVALNAILNVNGYGYVKTNNIVRILPLSEIGEQINTVTETFDLSYAQADDAKKTLQGFLSKNGGIEVDDRTNMVVVTDTPSSMDRIKKLIRKLDRRVKQVLIEVIILDSILLDNADLGVSWGLLNTRDNSRNSKEALRLDEEDPFPDQFNVNLPVGADALNVVFGTLIDNIDLNVFIDAVVSDTDSRVLANPKILTVNNETAIIEIIQEFPYNDVTQTSSGGQLSNITFKEIGTKLEVKPQITHDDHVILWVAPEQNSIAGATVIGVPIVDTRKAETTLIVKNHETIVMGGLRENRNVNTLTKVPFLGDLPGVKYAFRSVQSDKQDTELLVFLTVHIVESAELQPGDRIKAEELANLPRRPNSTIELIRR